jgi:GxxExxY protein
MLIEPPKSADRAAYQVIGAALAVHRALGPGFAENVYENALCVELDARGAEYIRQHRVPLRYRGEPIGVHIIDLLVDDVLIVELKAVDALGPLHVAQVNSYLVGTGKPLGLLLNFNVPQLRAGIRRVLPTTRSLAAHTP